MKYGKLPEKLAEIIPWETLCIHIIGAYKIKRKGEKLLHLRYITIIDPATGCFEIE